MSIIVDEFVGADGTLMHCCSFSFKAFTSYKGVTVFRHYVGHNQNIYAFRGPSGEWVYNMRLQDVKIHINHLMKEEDE